MSETGTQQRDSCKSLKVYPNLEEGVEQFNRNAVAMLAKGINSNILTVASIMNGKVVYTPMLEFRDKHYFGGIKC